MLDGDMCYSACEGAKHTGTHCATPGNAACQTSQHIVNNFTKDITEIQPPRPIKHAATLMAQGAELSMTPNKLPLLHTYKESISCKIPHICTATIRTLMPPAWIHKDSCTKARLDFPSACPFLDLFRPGTKTGGHENTHNLFRCSFCTFHARYLSV
jgi:hypothetical protein